LLIPKSNIIIQNPIWASSPIYNCPFANHVSDPFCPFLINFMCAGDELHNFVTVIRLVGGGSGAAALYFTQAICVCAPRADDARCLSLPACRLALLRFRVHARTQPTTILRHPVVNISLNVLCCVCIIALVKEAGERRANQDTTKLKAPARAWCSNNNISSGDEIFYSFHFIMDESAQPVALFIKLNLVDNSTRFSNNHVRGCHTKAFFFVLKCFHIYSNKNVRYELLCLHF
jgi:hypothetical protein